LFWFCWLERCNKYGVDMIPNDITLVVVTEIVDMLLKNDGFMVRCDSATSLYCTDDDVLL